jgi:hypothetical protein
MTPPRAVLGDSNYCDQNRYGLFTIRRRAKGKFGLKFSVELSSAAFALPYHNLLFLGLSTRQCEILASPLTTLLATYDRQPVKFHILSYH